MADLPVDRTTANTPAEHVADHNVLHATHNLIDGDGSNGQVLTRVGGVPTWAAPSGSSVAQYYPDAVPSSPHANDDEFNNASLGVAWTEWDAGAKVTVTEGDYGLKLAHVGSSGVNNYGGVFRAIPVGDFTVITKMSMASVGAAGPAAGVFVAADLAAAPTTADFHTLVHTYPSQATIAAHLFGDYTTFGSTLATMTHGSSWCYMRIRRVSTLFSFDFSHDGVSWVMPATFTPAYTPASIGLLVNNSSGTAHSAYFRFWRQSTSQALDTPLLGRIVT